jgi:tetratricopeptide (TPR) repeat protein
MILAIALVVWGVSAQPAKAPTSPVKLVEQARAARAKGDVKTALRLLDEAIEKQPGLRDAAALKVELTASSGDLADAFAAYDRYVAVSEGRGDRSLLSPIAKAVLRELRSNDLIDVRASALASLAQNGDVTAKKELERAAASKESPALLAVDAALTRLGDEAAAARFAVRVREGSMPARVSALEATKEFATAPPAVARAIVGALEDQQAAVRAAAAQAAGRLKIREALPVLRRTLGQPVSYLVKLSAAVSLHILGDPAGDDLLRQALASDMAEAKVFAASAFTAAEARVWRPTIESVLATSRGIDALSAAEVLLTVDSEAAQKMVENAAGDPNPSIRARAARIAGRQRSQFAGTVRRLLEDESPIVRLYVAEGLLQAEQPATLKR